MNYTTYEVRHHPGARPVHRHLLILKETEKSSQQHESCCKRVAAQSYLHLKADTVGKEVYELGYFIISSSFFSLRLGERKRLREDKRA